MFSVVFLILIHYNEYRYLICIQEYSERMQNRKYIKIGVGTVFGLFILLLGILTYFQSIYLSLKVFDQEVKRVEMVIYESEPFNSEITDIIFIEDQIFHSDLSKKMNMQNIALSHPKITSTILFIYYKNGTVLNAYVYGDKLGLNYGQVWLNVSDFFDDVSSYK